MLCLTLFALFILHALHLVLNCVILQIQVPSEDIVIEHQLTNGDFSCYVKGSL